MIHKYMSMKLVQSVTDDISQGLQLCNPSHNLLNQNSLLSL